MLRIQAGRGLRAAGWLMIGLFVAGCATHREAFQRMEQHLWDAEPAAALAALESVGRTERDQALYELNRGLLLRMDGDLDGSIAAFERAKQLGLDLTAISPRETLTALTLAEGTRSYVPDVYERLLVHVYQALNFLERGEVGAARVEAVQLDIALRRLPRDDGVTKTGVEAFARYLAGLIYEAAAEPAEAMIAYRYAARAYERRDQPLPDSLARSLLRLTDYLRLHDEHADYAARFPDIEWATHESWRRNGELVVLVHQGLLPALHTHSVTTQDPRSGQLYRVALPAYKPRDLPSVAIEARAEEWRARGETVESVYRLAEQSLEQRLPGMTARALVRNVARHHAADQTREEHPLLAAILNVVGVLTEQADTRSWRSLPDTIVMMRVTLPPGDHVVHVLADRGAAVDEQIPVTNLGAGQLRFVSLHRPR